MLKCLVKQGWDYQLPALISPYSEALLSEFIKTIWSWSSQPSYSLDYSVVKNFNFDYLSDRMEIIFEDPEVIDILTYKKEGTKQNKSDDKSINEWINV